MEAHFTQTMERLFGWDRAVKMWLDDEIIILLYRKRESIGHIILLKLIKFLVYA